MIPSLYCEVEASESRGITVNITATEIEPASCHLQLVCFKPDFMDPSGFNYIVEQDSNQVIVSFQAVPQSNVNKTHLLQQSESTQHCEWVNANGQQSAILQYIYDGMPQTMTIRPEQFIGTSSVRKQL